MLGVSSPTRAPVSRTTLSCLRVSTIDDNDPIILSVDDDISLEFKLAPWPIAPTIESAIP